MGLTSTSLFVAAVVGAVLAPLLVLFWWHRGRARRLLGLLPRLAALLCCQALAVSALFLAVNNQYGFYTSWADLLGRGGQVAGITTRGLVAPGQGTVEVLHVSGGPGAGGTHQVLVWLPPQYSAPADARTRFPVLLVLPGQPSTPAAMFGDYNFAAIASQEVRDGQVAPFIAVFPPLMTNPPRDTECTDVARGPQAEAWLHRDVVGYINAHLRTRARPWSLLGWSTGAFCSTKLLLTWPAQFAAAAGFGGYYAPITDHTTGDLFGGSLRRRNLNSPIWRYRHGGLDGGRVLVVTGRQDRESYRQTEAFLRVTRGDPAVSALVFPTGGHNYRNYRNYLPSVLRWLARGAGGI